MSAIAVSKLQDVFVAINQPTEDRKLILLEDAGLITEVTNATTQQMAVGCLKQLKEFFTEVETSREVVKAPVLELCRKIDGLASEVKTPIKAQIDRLTKAVSDYAMKLELARREAEAKARKEAADKENERQRLIQDARKFEDETQRKEMLGKAAEIKQEQQTIALVPATVPQAEGMAAKPEWTYELQDIQEVYKDRPDFCELTLKVSVVKAALKSGTRVCKGLRIFEKMGVRV